MAKTINSILPATALLLEDFGERLRLARRRRKLTAKQVAERAGISTMTLRSLERGTSGATIGAYVAVMQMLGIEKDLCLLAQTDEAGRALQDAQLMSGKRRAPRSGEFVHQSFIPGKQPSVDKTPAVQRNFGRNTGIGAFANTMKEPGSVYLPASTPRRDTLPQDGAAPSRAVNAEDLFRLLDIPDPTPQSVSGKR